MPTSDSEDDKKNYPTVGSKTKTTRRKKSVQDSSDEDKKVSTSKSKLADQKSTIKTKDYSRSAKSSTKKELSSDDDAADLQKEIKKLKDELKKTKSKIKELTDKCDKQEETIDNNERKFTREKKKLERTIKEKSEEIEELKEKLNLERKKEKKSPYNSIKPEAIEKLKDEHKEEINKLEKENKGIKEVISDQKGQLEYKDGEIDRLEKENKRKDKEISDQKQKMENKDEELTNLRVKLYTEKDNKKKYEDYERRYCDLELKNEELVKQVDALADECAKKNTAITNMKAKLVEKNTAGVSTADHQRVITESKVKQAEIDELKNEKVRLTEKLKKAEDDLVFSKKDVAKLDKEIANMKMLNFNKENKGPEGQNSIEKRDAVKLNSLKDEDANGLPLWWNEHKFKD